MGESRRLQRQASTWCNECFWLHETNILRAVWLERPRRGWGREKKNRWALWSVSLYSLWDAEVYLAETSEAPTRCLFAAARHADAAVGLLLLWAGLTKSGGVSPRNDSLLATQVASRNDLQVVSVGGGTGGSHAPLRQGLSKTVIFTSILADKSLEALWQEITVSLSRTFICFL